MNATARLVTSRKDIDGVIMVQAGGLLLLKVRVSRLCSPSTLFAG
jgi:hypothetical protein